ncbi:MAG: DegT/DnrJ/EryC1/StrS family aminotransferase [Solirubrobacterales bacterium]|nr:DegT/DnrJ/EryC1/StrS family aminotransferase [Solirubrobacterales bacterium]
MGVPLFDTDTPLAPLREELTAKVTEVINGGRFILGPEVSAFETELAEYVGVGHALGVGNGTDALAIALRALGIEAGDPVIVPALTFYATAEAVAAIGARPVFADVDPSTRNLSVDTVAAALKREPQAKAIITVDLFGLPAPSPAIKREFSLPVIEDAAQAIGASLDGVKAGALADIATFSFYPSKNLGAFGDGGAVLTDDPELAATVKALRFHGSRDKQSFELVGYNSRLDEIQAAVLRILLRQLDGWAEGRRRAAASYRDRGIGRYVGIAPEREGTLPAWHLYVVTHPQADAVIQQLNDAGIQARAYYRTPLHRQPAMAPYVPPGLELPITDELARTIIALPISPVLSTAQAQQVVDVLAEASLGVAEPKASNPAGS